MKTATQKAKWWKSSFLTALTALAALSMTACGSKNASSNNSVNPYNAYNIAGVGGTTGVVGSGVPAIGFVRDINLQADILLDMIPIQSGIVGSYANSGNLQVTGTMVVGANSPSCQIPMGTYSISGQAQYSMASFTGIVVMANGTFSTQVYFNSYLQADSVTSLYVGTAPYLIQNSLQIQGCASQFLFQYM